MSLLLLGFSVVIFVSALFDLNQEFQINREIKAVLLKTSSSNLWESEKFIVSFSSLLGFGIGIFFFYGSFWFGLSGLCLGFLSAALFLRERKIKKQWHRLKLLPDFLELFSMGLSGGFSFPKAWAVACEHLTSGNLKEDLQRAHQLFLLGCPKEDVLKDLMRSWENDPLSSVWSLFIQSLKRGSPIQALLLDQAEHLRNMAYLRIEKKAHTISLRLLFPIFFFIFPSLFIVIFGPLAVQYIKNGGLF